MNGSGIIKLCVGLTTAVVTIPGVIDRQSSTQTPTEVVQTTTTTTSTTAVETTQTTIWLKYDPTKPIEFNEQVRQIQEKLKALGYSVTVDGLLGPVTDRAIRSFQEANNLTVDGIVGPVTLKILNMS